MIEKRSKPNGPRRVLLLTGASRGIGHATVKRFSAAGWRVITVSRQPFPEQCPWEMGPEDHIQLDLGDTALQALDIRLFGGEFGSIVFFTGVAADPARIRFGAPERRNKILPRHTADLDRAAHDFPLMVAHGSITVNGVSLTVNALHDDGIQLSIIEYTKRHTTLGELVAGDRVHVEADVLAKHVERLLTPWRSAGVEVA